MGASDKRNDTELAQIERGLEAQLYKTLITESSEDELPPVGDTSVRDDAFIQDDDFIRDDNFVRDEGIYTEGRRKSPHRRRRSVNREYTIVSYAFVALFLAFAVYFAHYIVVEADSFIGNSYNRRITEFSASVVRGDIVTSDGVLVATSQVDEDGNETRIYPEGALYAHAVGYSTKGMSGVELDANYSLLGSHVNIGEQAVAAVSGNRVQGDTVVLTLDSDLQQCAYQNLGSYDGAIIALDPSTGAILAMVSQPTFDPNEIADIWDDIVADPTSSMLVNRATQGLYPPGSTFKMVTGLEYLAEGGAMTDSFYCEGSYTVEDYTIHCYNSTVHGSEDFLGAFAESCNVAFSQMGLALDRDSYTERAESMYFNTTLPTRLSNVYESSFSIEDASDALVMQTSIGQGQTLATPIHLALIVSAAANDGRVMEPYIIDRVENAGGQLVKKSSPASAGRMLSVSEAGTLREMLRAVVTDGNGSKLQSDFYTAYGKTGTAEYSNDKSLAHSWFVGYAEANGRQLVIAAILEEAGTGGTYALPLAKRMFDEYFIE